jgi:lipopolysaccharide biosynthesis regulator YciM
MAEYLLAFILMLCGSAVVYLLYDRYVRPPQKTDSTLYVEALRDLLDGRQEAAFSKLRQVVAEDTTNIDAYLRIGQILRDNNKPERALQIHKDLTLRGRLSAQEKSAILRQLALDYGALKNVDLAEAALTELRSLDANEQGALRTLLKIQQDAGKWEEAFETASAILKAEGNKSRKPLAWFKYQMGQELNKKKEFHKARVQYKEALGYDSGFVAAYIAIGDAYAEERRFEDAVTFWTKLIDNVPTEGHQVIDRLKSALFDLGRFGELVELCEKIIQSDPRNVEARMTLADIYAKKGDLMGATDVYAQVVEDQPANIRAITGLVRLYLERGDRKKLETLFRDLERHWGKSRRVSRTPHSPSQPVEIR